MNGVTFAALTFIIWWVLLFALLSFGLRTQDDDNDVTLGTTASAPTGPHVLRAMFRTTIATAAVMTLFYLVTEYWGYGFSDIPMMVPDFINR